MKINTILSFRTNFCSNPRNNTKTFKDKNSGSDVVLKKGVAYNPDDTLYTGAVSVKNKNGNNWELKYEKGLITESAKNGELYKIYDYPEYIPDPYFFKDGSYVDENEFYGFGYTPKVMDVTDGKTITSIARYADPKYKGEPIVNKVKNFPNGKTEIVQVYKTDGNKKPEFSSLIDAELYFLSNYGIVADFSNLTQAHIVKDAVDAFMNIGMDKDCFEGLMIAASDDMNEFDIDDSSDDTIDDDEQADIECSDADFENIDEIADELEMIPIAEYYCYTDESSLASGYKGKPVNPIIVLNNKYNWSDSFATKDLYDYGDSSTATIRGNVIHELVHFLHSKESFSDFYYRKEDYTPEEELVAMEVSDYATLNSAEFVAEYAAGRIEGNKYSPEAFELYKKFGGPNLFKNEN